MFLEFVHVRSCDFCGFWRFEAQANCILPAYFLAQRRVASHESEAGPLSLHNVNGQGIDLYRA